MSIDSEVESGRLFYRGKNRPVRRQAKHSQSAGIVVGDQQMRSGNVDRDVNRARRQRYRAAVSMQGPRYRVDAERADSVMVFADGREVFSAPTAQLLPHRVFKQSGLFGFQFELPRGLLPPQGSGHRVRVFAIRLGVATELRRKPVWPWG